MVNHLGPLALFSVLALGLCACGEDDHLAAFDVELVTISDCFQRIDTTVNPPAPLPVSCEDTEALLAVTVLGRWIFDYRGRDTFVATTHDGRAVPGVFFANDGQVLVSQRSPCQGQGGTCHFARTRTDETDLETGCLRISERVIDVVVNEGTITGEVTDVQVSEDGCGDTSVINEEVVSVEGVLANEVVRAREVFQ